MTTAPSGISIVDKEAEWTSHDVVARARSILGTRKVGHSGTLDPDATGVLVLGVGRATRLLRFLTGLDKTYTGEMVLGIETSTLDASGEVTVRHDMAGITLEDVAAVARRFVGPIEQVPPMVSAVKVGGRRLHELAREGKVVDRDPRPVTIRRLDVDAVPGEPSVFGLSVDCSSGTYIRTLAADIGAALGGGAHLRSLRRLAVGPYRIEEATALEDIALLPAAEGWRERPRAVVDDAVAAAVGHGKVLDRATLGVSGDGPWGVLDHEGTLLAVYEAHRGDAASGTVKPALVLAP